MAYSNSCWGEKGNVGVGSKREWAIMAAMAASKAEIAEAKAEIAKVKERSEESIRAIIGETAGVESLTEAERAEFEGGVLAFLAEMAGVKNLTEAEFEERFWAFQEEGAEVAP